MPTLLCLRRKVPNSELYSAVDSCSSEATDSMIQAPIKAALLQNRDVSRKIPSLA